MNRNDIELMAPVGSFESLAAAIQGGANAVYFGIENLNMRAQSSVNFTIDDIESITSTCKDHGMRTYLTLNTVMYDNDLPALENIISVAKKSGITAVIASDMAAIQMAREQKVEVHISTQCNISNIEAVKFYAQFADVMVLARELNLEQVKEISSKIKDQNICGPSGKPVKLELFIHGALCQAISGKCYLSLHEKNYSANRGRCLQTCRKAYVVKEKETGYELEIDNEYIMSPKDLCTIHFLNKIIDSGVSVLKIEGRARSPEYVKIVCECYDGALTAIADGSFSTDKITTWKEKLSAVFNRGFWDGYYLGQKLGEWSHVYGSVATRKKTYLGKVTNYFSNLNVGEFLMETGTLEVGDDILIIGPTTGVIEMKASEIRVNLISVNSTTKGDAFSMPVATFLRRSDKLYKWSPIK
jgi:U32 family peptidase